MSDHDNHNQSSQEAEEFDRFMFETNYPRLFDEGKGAGGVGGDDYDSDDEFDEDDELHGFTFGDDGDADFDTEGRALDVNPYGDPDD